jgi:hypothetical protein
MSSDLAMQVNFTKVIWLFFSLVIGATQQSILAICSLDYTYIGLVIAVWQEIRGTQSADHFTTAEEQCVLF